MTLKNTKTILFASLIAAMILPFSGMNYAVAETPVDDKTKNYVKNKIANLENTASTASIAENSKESYELEKLKLVEKWINAKENGNEKRMNNLMDKITADFVSDDEYTKSVKSLELSEEQAFTTASNPFISYTGSTEKHWDCRDDSDLLGYGSPENAVVF